VWRGDIVIIKNTPVVRSYLIYIAAYLLDIFIPWRHGYVLTFFFGKKIQHILLFSKSLGSKILIHCLLSKNANIYCYYMSIFIMSVFGVAWRAGGSECNVKQK